MPSYGAESREGYLSSRSRSRLRSGCGCGCGCTSKWMMSGNHITPINHTFANVFYGCKRILKTFWLISFKYCQWADSDKVSPCESRLMQCALTLAFPSHFPPPRPVIDIDLTQCRGEREKKVERWGREINSDCLAFKCTSFNPSAGKTRNGTNIWRRRWQRFVVFPAANLSAN